MAYPGKGNEGQFLGIESGLLKWLQVSQGTTGGGIGVTVAGLPVIADFETLNAAISGDATVLNVIGNVIEPADVPLASSSGLTIRLFNNPSINMGVNSFLWSVPADLNIRGNGEILFNNTILFDFSGNTGRLNVDGVKLTNQLAATGTITNGTGGRFMSCAFDGGLRLDGIRNSVVGADIASGIIINSTGENNMVTSSQLEGSNIVDAGSGTILADIRQW